MESNSHLNLGANELELIKDLGGKSCPYDYSNLSYSDAQSLILLHGLSIWFEQYGLNSPYRLNFKLWKQEVDDEKEWSQDGTSNKKKRARSR